MDNCETWDQDTHMEKQTEDLLMLHDRASNTLASLNAWEKLVRIGGYGYTIVSNMARCTHFFRQRNHVHAAEVTNVQGREKSYIPVRKGAGFHHGLRHGFAVPFSSFGRLEHANERGGVIFKWYAKGRSEASKHTLRLRNAGSGGDRTVVRCTSLCSFMDREL